MIKFVSDFRQVGGFLRVLRFPSQIKLILFGCKENNEELNTLLLKSVHKFIRQTCKFNKYVSPTVILSQHNLYVLPPTFPPTFSSVKY